MTRDDFMRTLYYDDNVESIFGMLCEKKCLIKFIKLRKQFYK